MIGGGVTTTGALRDHVGGPEQCRQCLESPESVHLYRQRPDQPRAFIRSASACGSSACRTTKTSLRASSAQASFASLTTFLQGTADHVSGGPRSERTGLAKLVRRVVCAGCDQAAAEPDGAGSASARSSPPDGMRNPAARPITSPSQRRAGAECRWWAIRCSRRTTRRSCSRRASALRGMCSATARPRSAPASELIIR